MAEKAKGPIDPTQSFLGKEVIIMQGTGGESTSYFTGKVKRIAHDLKRRPISIVLDSGTVVPYDPSVTSVSIISAGSN